MNRKKQLNLKELFFACALIIMTACGGSGGNETDNPDPVNQFKLTTSVSGQGSISSSPAGIDCGNDCQHEFAENAQITLIASSAAGYELSSWSGDCEGSASCIVTMDQARSVTATFAEISQTVFSLNVTSSVGGRVVSTPAGIDCGSDCSEPFNENTSVELNATAEQGYIFDRWEGDCSGGDDCNLQIEADKSVSAIFRSTAGSLSIEDMGMHEVDFGEVFTYQPVISGNFSICRKDMGHDEVKVDSETGAISWDTSQLDFGRGFHIRIKCSSYTESAYASLVVHVDRSGTSRLRVAGEGGVSPYIGVAGQAMSSGDTIVFPDGLYPVSVTADESFENAFKSTAPTNGTATQFSTIIARTPGGVLISGAAQADIPKQKNAFQFSATDYVAVVGFVVEDVLRESLSTVGPANRLLIDFVGAAGAGTEGRACSNFTEAASGQCSKAGMRINGGTPLFQNSYDWGHNRYGIMTRSTSGSITRRSFVRLDEHRGDQPYGGFSNYCDSAHLSQDNTVFDVLAIAAPHYKNYAGLEAYPATGCENDPATLKTEGLLAVNNKLSLSLMDQKAGPIHIWDHIVSYDSEGTCTPQSSRCGNWLLQADKETHVENSFFGKARGFEGQTSTGAAFDSSDVILQNSVTISDVPGQANVGSPPRYLPETLLYFRGKSDTFYGDTGYDQVTTARRWPIGGEDIIAANMRRYDNPDAISVGGGTVHISGDRGAAQQGQSMSEYFWGYIDNKIPPLVVRVKNKESYHRIAWEHLSGLNKDSVAGWKVICVSDNNNLLAVLEKDQLVYQDQQKSCTEYAVLAVYSDGDSGYAYVEVPQTPTTPQVLVENYTEKQVPFQLSQIGNNGSGITWHAELQQYLVVQNNAATIYRYDSEFNYLGKITKGGNINNDTEGLAFVGDNQVMVVTEANVAHKAVIDETTTVINGNYDITPAYRLLAPSPVSNKGLEGVAVRPADGSQPARVYACQEGTGANQNALMKLVYFDLPTPDPTDLMSYDSDLTVVEPFNAESAFSGVITDCAGMAYDTRTHNLIIVSQESSKVIQVNPANGQVISELVLEGAPQYEGVTIGPNNELVFMSEPNWVHIYQ
ncbi:InlB B-repeat-containing protein [Aliikangiella sp. IMCC44359]|uniref:InlB B-repeat-containing protein n=1 Tax=Aliikangiella sp. IMCC44359 TaxID=3459125 RepID=UPI00403AD123